MFSTAMVRKPSATPSGGPPIARRVRDLLGEGREFPGHRPVVQGSVPVRPEHVREESRHDTPEHDVAVGDRQRAAPPIARRARIGAGGIGTDPGSARRRNGGSRPPPAATVWIWSMGARNAHARDLRLEAALQLSGEVRHVGRRAAHVEGDDLVEVRHARRCARRPRRRRPGPDRIESLPWNRLASVSPPFDCMNISRVSPPPARDVGGDRVDVTPQDGREIGVHHRGIATRDELDQRADLVARGDLRKAEAPGDPGDPPLVIGVSGIRA